jgi:hypothetical protein
MLAAIESFLETKPTSYQELDPGIVEISYQGEDGVLINALLNHDQSRFSFFLPLGHLDASAASEFIERLIYLPAQTGGEVSLIVTPFDSEEQLALGLSVTRNIIEPDNPKITETLLADAFQCLLGGVAALIQMSAVERLKGDIVLTELLALYAYPSIKLPKPGQDDSDRLSYLPQVLSQREVKTPPLNQHPAYLYTDIESEGIEYNHILVIGEQASPELVIASEYNELGGDPFLCSFDKDGHHNFGPNSEALHLETFEMVARELAADILARADN